MILIMASKTKVVNKYHNVPYDVYIGRGSKWGNPFSHLPNTKAQYQVKTRKEAIEKYREWIMTQPHLLSSLHELKGKTLGCFCKPKPCHGDILVELIELLVKDEDSERMDDNEENSDSLSQ